MKIYYYSMTGNCESFLKHTGQSQVENIENVKEVNEPFVIVTGTVKFGETPEPVLNFLRSHSNYLVGVASSGNRNWGERFAKAGHNISREFNVPLLLKFELRGQDKDVKLFNERIDQLDKLYRTK